MEDLEKNVTTIAKSTFVSIGLLIVLIGASVFIEHRLTVIEVKLDDHLNNSVIHQGINKTLEDKYVTRTEIENHIETEQRRIRILEKKIER